VNRWRFGRGLGPLDEAVSGPPAVMVADAGSAPPVGVAGGASDG